MKIIKAKVYYKRTSGRTTYREDGFEGYPACWNNISPIDSLCTSICGVQESSDIDGTYQTWLLTLTDEDYKTAVVDPHCSTITQVNAEAIVAEIDPNYGMEEVTDETVLWKLLIKSARGKPISIDDEDALDPDKPAKGINRKKNFMNKHAITW